MTTGIAAGGDDATQRPLHVAICGGGRTGHLNAVLFKQMAGVKVSLLTRRREVIARHREGQMLTAILPDQSLLSAHLDAVSEDPADVVADADVVLITVPAHARPGLLREIAPHLRSTGPVYVGAIPGFCGFDWLAEKALQGQPNAVIWGMKDVPHTAYDLKPGVSVRMGGPKSTLYIGTHARESDAARDELRAHLGRIYTAPVELLSHYLEITLTPGNPIMHSSVVYGLVGPYGQWHDKTFDAPVCWWTDCTELGAYFLERSDEESQALCKAIEQRLELTLSSVKPLKQEIIEAYGDQIRDPASMLSVLRTNQAYDAIEAPLVPAPGGAGYTIDTQSRAFHEDVAYGLSLLVAMAGRLKVPVPHIAEIFHWNVSYMNGLRGSALDYFPERWPA
ncbi:MAG: NAD/NADP octopine/nopaline dehydrogenase family protein [Polaromonas sp.]|uniref:NAD/NADP octopine/nopaline dehydrogenase family protein n=1 Tax=Polaromonas sp. TaxID=1869339 RepID=UPI00326673F4